MDFAAAVDTVYALGYNREREAAERWLQIAYRSLLRADKSIAGRLASGDLAVEDVSDVVIGATLRVLRNPEGWQSESTSIDDYTESGTRADSTQDVYYTAAELRGLAAEVSSTSFTGSIPYRR